MAVSSEFIGSSSSQEPTASQKHSASVLDIHWNAVRHSIVIGGATITLTPTEYRLLYPLRHGIPVAYADLAMIAYCCPVDEKVRVMMDKHIDRIREKLRDKGIYVYCVVYYGYALLPISTRTNSKSFPRSNVRSQDDTGT